MNRRGMIFFCEFLSFFKSFVLVPATNKWAQSLYKTKFGFFQIQKFKLFTRDAGDSLLVPIDQTFLPDLRPKTDRDRIVCRGLDFVNDLYALNDPNYDVALMLRPVLVWPLNIHNKTA